ncbi:MAG TPA: hypothetical protein VGQ11_02160 [Candidatus Acidoferrales bacterium]|nr:hypothetical protein [Candidatus Acidoferrales bacterium]
METRAASNAGNCRIAGCKAAVPAELAREHLCAQHFTVSVEQRCAELRRETVGTAPDEGRRAEIVRYLGETGQTLAKLATGNQRLPDEQKARILNTFLTLMNLRENMDRAAARTKTQTEALNHAAKS